jgi:asparagine synthase (glutamine-hydrolysing)
MCGIVGQYNFNDTPVDEHLIRQMNAQLVHRGPDDDGFYFDTMVGFGSRRLSIIDLTTGHMPIGNEDGSVWITFNGEIYNFLELRQELVRRGHDFKTLSDTEVIVHLYEEYGVDCLQHLNGMFALAIWDAARQRLLLARDRLGKKPLVYSVLPDGVAFASEIEALRKHPGISTEMDYDALDLYMTMMYIPSPFTIFKAIRKLRPAHYLLAEKGQIKIERYWDIPYGQKRQVSQGEAVEELRGLMTDAVRRRLVSDVPLGAFLSGGLDSSAIVALMSGMMDEPVKTFSIGFESDNFNELKFARQIADRYQTDHHEFIIRPDLLTVLPELLQHYGEPYGDDSAVATYYVSKLAREHVTVALTGDGGDETFGGYPRYASALNPLRLLPEYLRDGVHSVARSIELRNMRRFLGAFKGAAYGAAGIAGEMGKPVQAFANRMTFLNTKTRNQLYSANLQKKIKFFDSWLVRSLPESKADWLALDKMFYLDQSIYMVDDILVKVDIASMANSLEVRCPILDYRIVEWSAALPPAMKVHGLETKKLFRLAFADLMPQEILARQKMGFAMPIDEWIRGELYEITRDYLTDQTSRERGLFNQKRIVDMLDRHKEGADKYGLQLWLLVMFEIWMRSVQGRA